MINITQNINDWVIITQVGLDDTIAANVTSLLSLVSEG